MTEHTRVSAKNSKKVNRKRSVDGEDIPQKTATQNRWGANIWMDWSKRHNASNCDMADYIPVPEVLHNCSREELGYWLPSFVNEVRRRDGTEYPYNSVYQICCAIKRYMNNYHQSRDLDIFNRRDPIFCNFNSTLDKKMEEDASKGNLMNPRVASDPITRDDEVKLWESGVINTDSSLGLSFAVFFYNCKLFNVFGKDEHYSLTSDQYRFYYDPESGRECIEFRGVAGKHARGVPRKLKTFKDCIRHVGDPLHPRCIVTMFKKYLSIIPPGHFYLAPNTGAGSGSVSYACRPIGTNKLKCYLEIMFKLAKIDVKDRRITTHSLKYDRLRCSQEKTSVNGNDLLLPLDTYIHVTKSSPPHITNGLCSSRLLTSHNGSKYTTMVSEDETFSKTSEIDGNVSSDQSNYQNHFSNYDNDCSSEMDIPIVMPSDQVDQLNQSHGNNRHDNNITSFPQIDMPIVTPSDQSNLNTPKVNVNHISQNHRAINCLTTNGNSVTVVSSTNRSETQTSNPSCDEMGEKEDGEGSTSLLPKHVRSIIDYVRNTGGGRICIELDNGVIGKVQIDL